MNTKFLGLVISPCDIICVKLLAFLDKLAAEVNSAETSQCFMPGFCHFTDIKSDHII